MQDKFMEKLLQAIWNCVHSYGARLGSNDFFCLPEANYRLHASKHTSLANIPVPPSNDLGFRAATPRGHEGQRPFIVYQEITSASNVFIVRGLETVCNLSKSQKSKMKERIIVSYPHLNSLYREEFI
jgi:hypothetical protein